MQPDANLRYAQACQTIVAKYFGDATLLPVLANQIRAIPLPQGSCHPMLQHIHNAAWDIAYEYQGPAVNKQHFDGLKCALDDFLAFRWWPTQWILSATYGKSTQSYGINIARHNGTLKLESANTALKRAIKTATADLVVRQTNEWFLKNLAYVLPLRVDTLELSSVNIQEYLMQ